MPNLSQYKTDISQYAMNNVEESSPDIVQAKIDAGIPVVNKTLSEIAQDRTDIIGDLFDLAKTQSGSSLINTSTCKEAMKAAYEAGGAGDALVVIFGIAEAFWSTAQFQLGNPLSPIVSETTIDIVVPDKASMSAAQISKFTEIPFPDYKTTKLQNAIESARLYGEREAEEIWYYYVSQIKINSYGLNSVGVPVSVLDQTLVN